MPNWIIDISGSIMSGLALIVLTVWATIFSSRRKHDLNKSKILFRVLIILILSSFFFQIFSAFRHNTYDTESIKYYDEKWDKMESKRIPAATALLEFYEKKNWDLVTNNTDDLDNVLGFFDNLGYDEQHGKVSAEVAWQYFYDDIADYYQGSMEYISISQKEDPTWFENVKPLFDDVTEIQSKKRHITVDKLKIDETNYLEYLRSEINLKNEK